MGKRLSAEEVLQHPWFAHDSLSGRGLEKAKDNLKDFQKNKRFKAAANAIMSLNFLNKLRGRSFQESDLSTQKPKQKTRRNKRNSIPPCALDPEDLAKIRAHLDDSIRN